MDDIKLDKVRASAFDFFFQVGTCIPRKCVLGLISRQYFATQSNYLLIMNECHVALFGFSDPRALLQELDKIDCFEV